MKTARLAILGAISLILNAGCAAPIKPSAAAVPSLAAAKPAPKAAMIAAKLAATLETDFVYPEQGRRYGAMLRANAAVGAYDALQGAALARRLTDDLQQVAADGHLGVRYNNGALGAGPGLVIRKPAGGKGAAPSAPKLVRPLAIEQARWLAPGIAYVRFNLFPGDPDTIQATQRFMAEHADAETLIFDVRAHRGGGIAEMDAIFPWLYGAPTRLVSMATRQSVEATRGSPVGKEKSLRKTHGDPAFVTREHWVTPGRDARLRDAKVLVLTSPMTASAAEHFALAFKHTGRATLIGRATRGANHFGGELDLGGGFTAFVPVGRTFDPITGKDWEGVGIVPDIDVPAESALVEALVAAGLARPEAERRAAEVPPPPRMARPGTMGAAVGG
jgi:hypothetical protein